MDCLGSCAVASVVAVARRDGSTGRTGPAVWLGGLEQPDRADGLAQWVRDGGPTRVDRPGDGLPVVLAEAVVGHGPGVTMPR